jgi:cytochrome oxidase Cu insertion factor (SCO1/SenC/PrrC family)
MSASRPLFIAACLILALLIGGVALTRAPENGGVLTTGKALVGGPFKLTDQHGKTVSDTDFRGKYMLVVFGYTFCPDVCPAELQVVTAALDALGPLAERIQPVFISIDPERDTVSQLALYAGNFHPRLVLLTGSSAEIADVAKAYRVYYAKAEGSANAGRDYLMDHSSIIYLMGPDGQFVRHFTYTTDAAALAEQLKQAIAR